MYKILFVLALHSQLDYQFCVYTRHINVMMGEKILVQVVVCMQVDKCALHIKRYINRGFRLLMSQFFTIKKPSLKTSNSVILLTFCIQPSIFISMDYIFLKNTFREFPSFQSLQLLPYQRS